MADQLSIDQVKNNLPDDPGEQAADLVAAQHHDQQAGKADGGKRRDRVLSRRHPGVLDPTPRPGQRPQPGQPPQPGPPRSQAHPRQGPAEPAERGIMQRAPRPPKESLFAHGMGVHIIWVGLLLTIFCLGLQYWAIKRVDTHWQTMVFTTLTLGQMAHVMAIRSESDSLLTQGLLSNRPLLGAVGLTFALQMAVIYIPFLQPIFKTQPLSLEEVALCICLALLVGATVEIEKAGARRRRKR